MYFDFITKILCNLAKEKKSKKKSEHCVYLLTQMIHKYYAIRCTIRTFLFLVASYHLTVYMWFSFGPKIFNGDHFQSCLPNWTVMLEDSSIRNLTTSTTHRIIQSISYKLSPWLHDKCYMSECSHYVMWYHKVAIEHLKEYSLVQTKPILSPVGICPDIAKCFVD